MTYANSTNKNVFAITITREIFYLFPFSLTSSPTRKNIFKQMCKKGYSGKL
jgi:hypothetical protein